MSHYELHSQGRPFSKYLLPSIKQRHCFFVTLLASEWGPGHRSSGEWGFCQKDPKCQWADRSMLNHTSFPSETIITSCSQKRIYKCHYLCMILLHMISCILLMLIQYFPLDFMFPMRFYYKKNPFIWMSLQIIGIKKKTLLTICDHEGKKKKSVYPFVQ